jgi:hypothetical protein
MCGLNKKPGQLTADGKPFSVRPIALVESDNDIMSGGMTRKQLREMLANATPLAEHEKVSAHADRGYSP